ISVAEAEGRRFQALHPRVAEPRKVANAVDGPSDQISWPRPRRPMRTHEIASEERVLTFAWEENLPAVGDDLDDTRGQLHRYLGGRWIERPSAAGDAGQLSGVLKIGQRHLRPRHAAEVFAGR